MDCNVNENVKDNVNELSAKGKELQQEYDNARTKLKYSYIPKNERMHIRNSEEAIKLLFKNKYVLMDAYCEIECFKLMKALKALDILHRIKFITLNPQIKWDRPQGYEFTLSNFEDDRV